LIYSSKRWGLGLEISFAMIESMLNLKENWGGAGDCRLFVSICDGGLWGYPPFLLLPFITNYAHKYEIVLFWK
jgi:hypothetical protein